MRIFKPGEAWDYYFTVSSASGAAANADALPTVSIKRNGTADGTVTVTVTNPATGEYKAACTIPSGYAAGDRLAWVVSATIGGAVAKDVLENIRLVACDITDVAALGLTRLDVAVSTRNAVAPDNTTIATIAGYIDTEVGAIKAKTDNLPSSPAAVSNIPTAASIAALILSNPANLLTVDGTGKVGANNLPADYQQRSVAVTLPSTAPSGYGGGSAPTVQQIRTEIDSNSTVLPAIKVKTDNLPAAPAAVGDIPSAATVAAQILATPSNKLVTDGTGKVGSNNLPSDYQQRSVAVTLPTTAPSGYGGSGSAPTVVEIRAEIDANSTKLAAILGFLTDADITLNAGGLTGTMNIFGSGAAHTGSPLFSIALARSSTDNPFSLNRS